jgi:hypothetical protein
MVRRGIVYRGRSDAACGLRGGTGDCARQRAAGTRLGIGTNVPDGGHQGGIKRRGSAIAAAAEPTDHGCAEHTGTSGRTCACPAKYFCAGQSTCADGSQREFRRPNCRARPNSEPIGLVWGGAGRDRSTGRGAGTAGALQRECLHGRLSFLQGSRLHLSAERWSASALLEVSASVD